MLVLRDSPDNLINIYLPERNAQMFSDVDIECINADKVWLNLTYKGKCALTKAYILVLERDMRDVICLFSIK